MKTVTTVKGNVKMNLVERVSKGWKPCPGDAHTNAYIDNCMICLGSKFGYGKVEEFEEPTVEQALAGAAVPVSWTREDRTTFLDAETKKLVKMVEVVEKFKGGKSFYYVWAKA